MVKQIILYHLGMKQRVRNPKTIRFWTTLIDADKLAMSTYREV